METIGTVEQWAESWLNVATMDYDEEDQVYTLRIRDKLIVHGEGQTQLEARADLLDILRCIAISGKLHRLPEP